MLKVVVERDASDQPLEKLVDADINEFEKWFREYLQNGEPLTKSERAILKTYCFFKTQGDRDAQGGG